MSQGRCGVLFVGALCQCVYFSIAAAKGSFPAMIVGFGFAGVGISLLSGRSSFLLLHIISAEMVCL